MTCTIEGCDRPVHNQKRGWCSLHYQRWRRTGDPTKTKSGLSHAGGQNKIEGVCDFEGCDRKRTKVGFCEVHKRQQRLYGIMWPVGEPNPLRQPKIKEGRWNGYMGSEYSEERTCGTCGETKNWKKFVMGTDAVVPLCRDCHRKKLSERIDVNPINGVGKHSKKKSNRNWDDLMDFLNSRTN